MDAQPETIIVGAVIDAISEQRLPAGAKLGEQALSVLFNCNRANVRRALAALEAKHVVELRPNRGAFVAAPSADEAREIFQARRAIERTIARQAVKRIDADGIARLKASIAAENLARSRRDKPAELRSSQNFHMLLAELAGNRVLQRFLAELTMRSTLILGMYAREGHSCAHCDDHTGIVDALIARDEALVLDLTDRHLRRLEAELDFERPVAVTVSLKDQIFGS
ncbi:GntR family transcriptional regulator [Paracoccus sp. TK19116]|uniref:GntR family transcriptional regulator n=1 Tax=Paracoccus albicereus TaxID=2922394 RepID=A0ABT1MQ55_9RHOB|nr:GntR family transcriptional regulator [Paracoccus albicereus]MCQ0970440.1 GntR family transcriptional regulator [Paracoccus albicereus]